MPRSDQSPAKLAALIVGVNRYDDQQIHGLDCAENDCIKLAGLLEYRGGYAPVVPLCRPDSALVLKTAAEMVRGLKAGDLFLFFFAGHGYEVGGRHLLLCPESEYARLEYMRGTVPVELLSEETARPGVHRAFVLDTCRTKLLRSRGGDEPAVLTPQAVQAMRNVVEVAKQTPSPLTILCSCSKGQSSAEVLPIQHGLFTAALLGALGQAADERRRVRLSDDFEGEVTRRMGQVASEYHVSANQMLWVCRSGPVPVILPGVAPPAPPVEEAPPTGTAPRPAPTRPLPPAAGARAGVPLHRSAWAGDVAAIKSRLTAAPEEISARDPAGLTPLHLAVRNARREAGEALLSRGADPNARDAAGATPLHEAARIGDAAIVRLLLDHGAEANVADNEQNTPLHVAAQMGSAGLAPAEVLLEFGADPAVSNPQRGSALHEAAWTGEPAMVRLLLPAVESPDVRNAEGAAPLHLAARCGEVAAAVALLEAGADANAPNDYGEAPLHVAAGAGHLAMAQRLLAAGADVNAEDNASLTPLSRAKWQERADMVLLLRQHGGRE